MRWATMHRASQRRTRRGSRPARPAAGCRARCRGRERRRSAAGEPLAPCWFGSEQERWFLAARQRGEGPRRGFRRPATVRGGDRSSAGEEFSHRVEHRACRTGGEHVDGGVERGEKQHRARGQAGISSADEREDSRSALAPPSSMTATLDVGQVALACPTGRRAAGVATRVQVLRCRAVSPAGRRRHRRRWWEQQVPGCGQGPAAPPTRFAQLTVRHEASRGGPRAQAISGQPVTRGREKPRVLPRAVCARTRI